MINLPMTLLEDEIDYFPRNFACADGFEEAAAQVYATRQKQGEEDARRNHEINSQVANIVITNLRERGRFLHDELNAYFFYDEQKKLIIVSAQDIDSKLLLAKYGIIRSESLYRYLIESIQVEAFERGGSVRVHRLASYDSKTFTLYVHNHRNQIYRVTPESIDLLDNGESGVLFLSDSRHDPFWIEGVERSRPWLDEFIISKINFTDGILTLDEQRLLFKIWIYSIFFESIMPTKAILAFIGEKGSGKSIAMRKVGMALFGQNFNVTPLTPNVKDFDAAVTNSEFVAIDNADTKCEWLPDRLATMATGGVLKRRELYTTNKLVEIPARCFLAITSRTPHFRRDDVADRLLIMRLNRFSSFKSEKRLLVEVIENRNHIMASLIFDLQEVITALRESTEADDSGSFRMADFADFAIKVARRLGKEEELLAAFSKLTRAQASFTLEEDSLLELLATWAAKNGGREVTNTELCRELTDLAAREGFDFPYEGKSRAFAQRMSHLRPNLAEFFTIFERKAGARKTLFRFKLKSDAADL